MAEYDPNSDQFELARKRASQQVNANVQGQQDALKRRFASMGALNSGAAIQQQNLVAEKGQEALTQANEGINAAQNQELGRQKERKEGMEFAKSEREAQQKFGAEQAELGRTFARGEREAGQLFGAGQAELQRKFMTGERMSAQEYQSAQNAIAQRIQESQFGKQMEHAKAQLAQQQWADKENARLAELSINQKGWMDSLLGPAAGNIGGLFGAGGPNGGIGNAAGSAFFGPWGTVGGSYYDRGGAGRGGYTTFGF